jgi:hypothetical protein
MTVSTPGYRGRFDLNEKLGGSHPRISELGMGLSCGL